MKIFPPVYVTYGLQLLHYFVVIFTPKNINIFVYSNKPMFIELYHGQGTEYESLYTGSNQLSKELFGIRNSFS